MGVENRLIDCKCELRLRMVRARVPQSKHGLITGQVVASLSEKETQDLDLLDRCAEPDPELDSQLFKMSPFLDRKKNKNKKTNRGNAINQATLR